MAEDGDVSGIPGKINSNLLKVNTHDKYATEGALRKEITKRRGQGLDKDVEWPKSEERARLEDVLPGLIRIGKNPKSEWAFFSFATDAARQAAKPFLAKIKGKKSRMWEPADGTAADDKYFERKARDNIRKREQDAQGPAGKRARAETIHDCTEPLYSMPYDEQLKKKEQNLRGYLKDITATVLKTYRQAGVQAPDWVAPEGEEACRFEGVSPSPTLDGYRNKVELSCGFDKERKPAVGFLFGRTYENCGWIEPPYGLRIVSDVAKAAARVFERIISESGLPVYDKMAKTGVWRTLLVREGRGLEGEPVVLIDILVNLTKPGDDFDKVCQLARAAYADFATRVGSLSVTEFTVGNNMCPLDARSHVLAGAEAIEDEALGKRFKVSPRSFFQVNSRGNEVLLKRIADFASLNKDTVLVDLCCGTGTIGLSLAGRVKKVIGIDVAPSAIVDARLNADRNDVRNAEYICGKAEDVVESALRDYRDDPNLVAIVDPPRCGLHSKVLRFLRQCSGLTRFVYVSCKQSSLVENCGVLCKPRSQKLSGDPFRPVTAAGVDLFPHCDQQELLVLFERAAGGEVAAKDDPEDDSKVELAAEEEEQ